MKEILPIDVDVPIKHPWVKSAIFSFHWNEECVKFQIFNKQGYRPV